jgi:DNA-binding CsgD family transcriptional regulator
MKTDILTIVETAYADCPDPDAWIRDVLEALGPHLDRGQGVLGHRFALEPEFWRGPLQGTRSVEDTGRLLDALTKWHLESRPQVEFSHFVRSAYPRFPKVGWLSDFLGYPWHEPFAAYAEDTKVLMRMDAVNDVLGIVAGDPSGRGCVFFAESRRSSPLTNRAKSMWEKVTAHLVAGYRLATMGRSDSEAVLRADGQVVHRERHVTDADAASLSDATRAMDHARGRLRRTDVDTALAIWKGLVAGRWSLVDHYDHDGRRYVVARRNNPEVRSWRALTAREAQVVASSAEGQSIKAIAYQLGVSPTTVSTDLARAQAKVGAKGRLALVSAYRAAQREETAP